MLRNVWVSFPGRYTTGIRFAKETLFPSAGLQNVWGGVVEDMTRCVLWVKLWRASNVRLNN